MKKVTLIASAVVLAGQFANAQTITATNNEPVAGDLHTYANYDTSATAALPKNTGTNQTWNFSALTINLSSAETDTFVAMSSLSFASMYPGATIAEDMGGNYNFYKSSASPAQFEWIGFGDNTNGVSFTNSLIRYTWPMAYGATFTDTFAAQGVGMSATYSGSETVTASGTGTITMPGGASFGNILQVRTARNISGTEVGMSANIKETVYDYFEPSQKFPLLTITIDITNSSGFTDTSITVTGNRIITVGITNRNFDAEYAIYPNPTKDSFSIKLTNTANEKCSVEIYNLTGQLVQSAILGNASLISEKISTSSLTTGVYLVKTTLGGKTSSRRLIIE